MEIHKVAPSRRLVVSLTRDRGAGFIVGRAHTGRARINVFCERIDEIRIVSVGDFESISDDSSVWLAGFLAGSEPSIYEYLGTDGGYDETPEELARWWNFLERFGRDGESNFLGMRPVREILVGVDEIEKLPTPFAPWEVAGEVVWVPKEEMWIPADPQPRLISHAFLENTICADRKRHRYSNLRSDWRVCDDCSNALDRNL